MSARAVVDFPDPLSPTIPIVLDRFTSKFASTTARTDDSVCSPKSMYFLPALDSYRTFKSSAVRTTESISAS